MMRYFRILALMLAVLLMAATVVPAVAPARADGESTEPAPLPYWIGVDVKNQRVTIYSTADNSVVHRWKCSTGKSSTPTPLGTYKLPKSGTNRSEWSLFGNVYVKWAVRITGGYYFHSVLFSQRKDSSLQTSSLKKLGSPASHGCIRLEVYNAKWIRDNVACGSRVIIHKGVDDKRITGVLGGKAGVKVTPSIPGPPKVKKLVLDRAGTVTLTKGEKLQLNCTIQPENAKTTLTWKSSNTKYAKVSSAGMVTAMGHGTATITVKAANGVKTTVKVKSVDPRYATKLSLNRKGTVYLCVGDTLQLTPSVTPDTAADLLTWKSTKASVASVSKDGLVTAVKKGTAKVSVTSYNKKKATVTIKVLATNAPAKVRILEKGPIKLHVGETIQLNTVLTPSTAHTSYKWTSSKSKYATVDGTGLVTARKKGTTKITVKTGNKKTAVITIKVVN